MQAWVGSRDEGYISVPSVAKLFSETISSSVSLQWQGQGAYVLHAEELVSPVWSKCAGILEHLLERGQFRWRFFLLLDDIFRRSGGGLGEL